MEPPLELQWGRSSVVVMCWLAPGELQCAGGSSLVVTWGSTLIAVRVHSLFVGGGVGSSLVVVCRLFSSCASGDSL